GSDVCSSDLIARTRPDCASITIIVPSRLPSAAAAAFCSATSVVASFLLEVAPGHVMLIGLICDERRVRNRIIALANKRTSACSRVMRLTCRIPGPTNFMGLTKLIAFLNADRLSFSAKQYQSGKKLPHSKGVQAHAAASVTRATAGAETSGGEPGTPLASAVKVITQPTRL